MHRFRLSFVYLTATLLSCLPSFGQSVDELAAAHVEALGGEEALRNVKSISRSGDVRMITELIEFQGTTKVVVVPYEKAYRRVELKFPADDAELTLSVNEIGWDGETAWRDEAPGGVTKLEGGEAQPAIGEAEFDPLVERVLGRDTDTLIELIGEETIEGIEYQTLRVREGEGAPVTKLYLGMKSKLITRWEFVDETAENGPITYSILDSDFKEFGGVLINRKSTIKVGDALTMEYVYTETVVNGEIDETIFDMPKE